MRQILYLIFVLGLSGCGDKNTTLPSDFLSLEEQKKILWQIVRYTSKLPPGAKHETKFDSKFDEYYQHVLLDFELEALKPDQTGGYYFLIFRPARSINPMFEGIGGQFKFERDSLVEYDEVFRTWKMSHKDLSEKGAMLFDRMTRGNDLSIYYSKYAGDKYIEFPDGRYFFDKDTRRWKNQELDSLQMD